MAQKKKLKEGKGEGILYQGKKSISRKAGTSGITLVALVVTIVVLLILAGITIMYVMGDNSVFKQASEAKLQTEIKNWQERLEMAKSTIIMEGLGKFNPDAYFKYIQDQGIANNVIDNKDGTYDVTTEPGYVYMVTLKPNKENPTDAEIEYLGKEGNLQPKIKGIKILEATKTSFKVKVAARPEGGTVEFYYKDKESVAPDEVENDTTDYTKIILDSSLVVEVNSGLEAGKTYKIKAVLKKDGKDIGWVSNEVKTTIIVTSVTLNKPTATIDEGNSETLIATVKPDNAEKKEIEWTTSSESVATVDQTGKVTGVAAGTATITATNTESGKSASCTVTVKEPEADWAEIAKWAEYIATNESAVSGDGTSKTAKRFTGDTNPLYIGQIFKVYYGEDLIDVEIIDFLHDDLADGVRYASDASKTKAGITFDFKDCIGAGQMNTTNTNAGGWASSNMRKKTTAPTNTSYLTIPDIRNNLSENLKKDNIIKKIKKGTYKYEDATPRSLDYTNDDLWLLSEWEVFGAKTYSLGQEGEQYAYYTNPEKRKKNYNGSAYLWWLRSPGYTGSTNFCLVVNDGSSSNGYAVDSYGVCPGFCI